MYMNSNVPFHFDFHCMWFRMCVGLSLFIGGGRIREQIFFLSSLFLSLFYHFPHILRPINRYVGTYKSRHDVHTFQ